MTPILTQLKSLNQQFFKIQGKYIKISLNGLPLLGRPRDPHAGIGRGETCVGLISRPFASLSRDAEENAKIL
jgi:hypothetical protein